MLWDPIWPQASTACLLASIRKCRSTSRRLPQQRIKAPFDQRRSRTPSDLGRPHPGASASKCRIPAFLSSGYTGRPCGCLNGFFDNGFAFGVAFDTGWGRVGFIRWHLLILESLGRDVGRAESFGMRAALGGGNGGLSMRACRCARRCAGAGRIVGVWIVRVWSAEGA